MAQLRLGPLQVCSMMDRVDKSTMDSSSSRIAMSWRICVSHDTSISVSLVTNRSNWSTRVLNLFESRVAHRVLVIIIDFRWCAARRLRKSTMECCLNMSLLYLLTLIQVGCPSSFVLSTATPYFAFNVSASWRRVENLKSAVKHLRSLDGR